MKCKIENCDRDADYKKACLCQKHYFRIRRNGSVEIKPRSRQYRITMPGKGYQRLYEPSHPLADSQGYISEHRKIVYEKYGDVLPPCEICGAAINWKTCHIDHIDNNVLNNIPDNLRPLCRVCNTRREYPPAHTMANNHAVTYNGITMTPTEWAKYPGVNVSRRTILLRIAAGMSVHDALFSQKKTHNGRQMVDNRPRKTSSKHERKNAVAITIDGETKTAMEWSRDPRCSVSDGAIRLRIKAGWNPSEAVTTPAKRKEIELAKIR